MAGSPSQLELELKSVARWGGRREGAGRRPGPRPRVLHRARERFTRHQPCHVTLRVRRGVPRLRQARLVRCVEQSFRALRARAGFRVVHYSIQSDHLHLIVEAEDPRVLARGMQAVAVRVALAVRRVFGGRGAVFADRFHQRVIRTPREARNAIAYVLQNARKHATGRMARALRRFGGVDPASSGRWFGGWRVQRGRAPDPPAVAEPRTWLLAVGWRRHGLVATDEVPGGRRSGRATT